MAADPDPGDAAGERQGAPAAACAADVLWLLARLGRPLSVAAMSRELGYTRSMLYRVLPELEDREFVTRADGSTFWLSLGVLELGGAVAVRQDVSEDRRDVLRDLALETTESTEIGVLNGADIVFVMKQEAPYSVVSMTHVGRRLPANCLAVGKMLLSLLPDDRVESTFAEVYPRQTSRSTDTWPLLRQELQLARERGYAVDYEGSVIGRCAVAIALELPGHDRDLVGLQVTGSIDEFDDRLEERLEAMYRARKRLERSAAARLAMHDDRHAPLGQGT